MAGKKDLERLRRRKRRKQNIIRATVHFFVWAGVAVLYYVGFSLFFDTPVEYELKHSTDRLRRLAAELFTRSEKHLPAHLAFFSVLLRSVSCYIDKAADISFSAQVQYVFKLLKLIKYLFLTIKHP